MTPHEQFSNLNFHHFPEIYAKIAKPNQKPVETGEGEVRHLTILTIVQISRTESNLRDELI